MTGRRHRDAGPRPSAPPDQRLARRSTCGPGSLSLARAELETMAGDGILDDEALIDLAEVRWRTGDLPGAGEAADAYLEAGHETTLGLVIAAEAQAALGRPSRGPPARRPGHRAGRSSLDGVFAGLPRSSIWPRDAGTELVAQPDRAPDRPADWPPGGERRRVRPVAPDAGRREAAAAPACRPLAAGHVPDGSRALRAAEEASRPTTSCRRRSSSRSRCGPRRPSRRPSSISARGQEGPAFDLIRGDAFRLVGREARPGARSPRPPPPARAGRAPPGRRPRDRAPDRTSRDRSLARPSLEGS